MKKAAYTFEKSFMADVQTSKDVFQRLEAGDVVFHRSKHNIAYTLTNFLTHFD